MSKFKSLEQEVYSAYVGEGQPGSLDTWATGQLKGLRTSALPTAWMVKSGAITSRRSLEIRHVDNQGFNGQVALVKIVSTGKLIQIPLKELKPVN